MTLPAMTWVAESTRSPDSGRAAGVNGSGSLSPILTISTNGFSARCLPWGCAAHSSGVRTTAKTSSLSAAASSSSMASHLDTALAMLLLSGEHSRNELMLFIRRGYAPVGRKNRPSLVWYRSNPIGLPMKYGS
jgi:hypothetical protein